MILNNAPASEAVMSNVGQIGEFRIRNSAKAFNILSSGLYSNKIRAIIRELSCNAVDSHMAAGNPDAFEVHLPTVMEPWFSIRDFGTGLSNEQVANIYTTYFESTKTDSNAYIGALGLGSKSPFSYTDNFSVTAIKDGRKGIYSAFINDEGIPSIAMMSEEDSTERNGVEVKFSVNDRYDFSKFKDEALNVYQRFALKPIITGVTNFDIYPLTYETENIVDGVHSRGDHKSTVAVMGNIAYPVDVPNKEKNLEGLHQLLGCGLEMHFDIGELDFQASREGLSYIPQTINAIKTKLQKVNSSLTTRLAVEADAITNEWERSAFLYSKKTKTLWNAAVLEYATNTKFDLYDAINSRWGSSHTIRVTSTKLAEFNIDIAAFQFERGKSTANKFKIDRDSSTGTTHWNINVEKEVYFVENDGKVGATERAKYHWRNKQDRAYRETVFVLNKIDKTKPIDTKGFFATIHNPPIQSMLKASDLNQKARVSGGMGKNVSILRLEERGGSRNHRNSGDLVFRSAGTLDSFDNSKTYYYVPVTGYTPIFSEMTNWSLHQLKHLMASSTIDELKIEVYGVRVSKGDLTTIKTFKNWINIEDHIKVVLNKTNTEICMATVLEKLDNSKVLDYNKGVALKGITNTKSPAAEMLKRLQLLPKHAGTHSVNTLMKAFKIAPIVDVVDLADKYNTALSLFKARYPLIEKFGHYAKEDDLCEYINLVDSVKGV